jgi:hypothetical protein
MFRRFLCTYTLISLFPFLLPFPSSAQVKPSRYFIEFTDKNNNAFSLSSPLAFLTQRSLDRRTKQNINLDSTDLPVTSSYVDSVASKGVTVLYRLKWFNGIVIRTSDSLALAALNAFPFVKGVKAIGLRSREESLYEKKFEHDTFAITSKAVPSVLKNSTYDYGKAFNQIDMLCGIPLHDNGFDGKGMIIAVLDAGFWKVDSLPAFDSLRANGQIISTWDFVDGNSQVYEDHTHGMMVLSTMGGYYPGEIIGTAPKAQYILLRSEEAATEYLIEEYNWVAAAEYADSAGADVINSSLGYTTFDDPAQDHTYADMNGDTAPITIGADIAASKGIFVVSSAGNEGNSAWNFISAAADGDSVLAVGAVDAAKTYAPFSSNGPASDGRVKPNVSAQGWGAAFATTSGTAAFGNGTSFSGPIIAGMTASLWSAAPNLTNMQVKAAIEQSASQYTNPDTLLGYGIPDYCKALQLLTGISLKDIGVDDLINVYPNPFSDYFVIEFSSDTNQTLTIEVYDLLGKKIFSREQKVSDDSISLIRVNRFNGHGGGLFILRIITEKYAFMKKVVMD